MHVASVELLHQHQEDATNEGEDERGDVGVGEVFANVNEGLVERASCLWAPTASFPTTCTPGWLTREGISSVLMEAPKQNPNIRIDSNQQD